MPNGFFTLPVLGSASAYRRLLSPATHFAGEFLVRLVLTPASSWSGEFIYLLFG